MKRVRTPNSNDEMPLVVGILMVKPVGEDDDDDDDEYFSLCCRTREACSSLSMRRSL